MNAYLMESDRHLEIELHLLTTAYFGGDFYILFQLINEKSPLFQALAEKKISAIQLHAAPLLLDTAALEDDERREYEKIFNDIQNKYGSDLRKTPVPPAQQFFEEFADNAVNLGKFVAASAALDYIKALDRKINQHITDGARLLKTKELLALPEDVDHPASSESLDQIEIAAREFFVAIKLKNPTGPMFQALGPDLHLTNRELWRKFEHYIAMNNLKEITNFCFHYLINDMEIATKIIDSMAKGKLRKMFLRKLAELFSNGRENYQAFIARYQQTVEKLRTAKENADFFEIQTVLLGRRTGTEGVVHYLCELSVSHPISALVCCLKEMPGPTQFLVPYLFHDKSIVELLELS